MLKSQAGSFYGDMVPNFNLKECQLNELADSQRASKKCGGYLILQILCIQISQTVRQVQAVGIRRI